MASWMVHLRIADILMERFFDLSAEEFIMGNIAPDSGVPNEDYSAYIPSKEVSHFRLEGERGPSTEYADRFAGKYLSGLSHTRSQFSFYFGYYAHLVTDYFWGKEIYTKAKERYAKEFAASGDFIWRIKQDWYDLDHRYLRDHRDFRGYQIFHAIKDFKNTYMSEFAEDAFQKRKEYITEFYDRSSDGLDREYPYLTEAEMDAFVQRTAERMEQEEFCGRFAASVSFLETLPEEIRKRIDQVPFHENNTGCSASKLLVFQNDLVLKVTSQNEENDNECAMMRWLGEKQIPVPKVYARIEEKGKNFLLMSRIGGKMACEPFVLRDHRQMIRMLAKALKQLWAVDIEGCPCDQRIEKKLAVAAIAIAKNEVDIEHMEPETFGSDGFKSPEDILEYLRQHVPEEDLVLSHGDFCLPNFFFTESCDDITGYIDLGRSGVADRYQDIALVLHSLKHNLSLVGKAEVFEDCKQQLFEMLGMEPNEEKIYYYRLLDELF